MNKKMVLDNVMVVAGQILAQAAALILFALASFGYKGDIGFVIFYLTCNIILLFVAGLLIGSRGSLRSTVLSIALDLVLNVLIMATLVALYLSKTATDKSSGVSFFIQPFYSTLMVFSSFKLTIPAVASCLLPPLLLFGGMACRKGSVRSENKAGKK